jgi:dipeptidyl aminopeptidase/acylaminoacyl peptidase
MQRDMREAALYKEAEALYRVSRQPQTGLISDAAEVSAHGSKVVFSGTLVGALDGAPPTRVCLIDLATADTRVLTFGPNVDRLPKFSPDGHNIAFLSDRQKAGDFQLYLLDPLSGAARSTPRVEGWVEYLHWSPDGRQILLGVAGHGADISGGQGAVTSLRAVDDTASWMPAVESGDQRYQWRRAWVYDVGGDCVRQVSHADSNIWEAVWCGDAALAAVVSPGPGEGLWYGARLHVIELGTGNSREVYRPVDQLGWPAASPSGRYLAIVEAISSDRWIVAGDLKLIDLVSGKINGVDTRGVDISYTEWRSDRQLLLAGHRGFETVIGLFDAASGTFDEVWASREISTAGFYVAVSGLDEIGACALVGEGFLLSPEIGVIRQGRYQSVKSFGLNHSAQTEAIRSVECVNWKAQDGLEIHGWLLRPNGAGPYPLVMHVHGGPVWQWHPVWLGRRGTPLLMLLKRGYAVFLPNPRGSTGRGRDFARHVLGDMGGADAQDLLSGLDALTERGVADPRRLGVMGQSYGGFMTAWLITQDSRFAAAVAVAPVTNHVTEHLLSNIPHFVSLFLADVYSNPGGNYFQRSPVMHAHKVKTPTLGICGSLDRCTPPAEAVQFHNALLEAGVKSVLVTYPEEGHGIRKLPAAIDYAARVVGWFEEHLGAGAAPSRQ